METFDTGARDASRAIVSGQPLFAPTDRQKDEAASGLAGAGSPRSVKRSRQPWLQGTVESTPTKLSVSVRTEARSEAGEPGKALPAGRGDPLTAVADDIDTPVLLIDPSTGDIVDCNQCACSFYGYPREQLIALKIWDINQLPPDRVLAEMRAASSKERRRFEFRHRLASGETREVEVQSGPVDLHGNQYLLSFVYDVTDRKSAERQLRESEARYRGLFEQMVAAFALREIVCDVGGHPRDFRYLDVNPAFEEMTGLQRAAVIGRTSRELPLRLEDFWIETYGRVALTGHPTRFVSYMQALGRYFEVSAYSPTHGQFAVTFVDVTEREAAEEYIRFQANLLDTVGQAVIATDKNGTIAYWNRQAEAMYGWSREEVRGRRIVDVITNDATQSQAEQIIASVTAGRSWSGEFLVRRRDGSEFLAFVTDTPILSAAGDVIGIVGVFTDVTERRQVQENLRISEEKFRGVFSQSPIGIEVYDRGGLLVDANAACLEMFGVSDVSAVLGFSLFGDPNLPPDAKAQILRGETARYESSFDFGLVHQSGLYTTGRSGLVWLDVLVSPLRSDGDRISGYLVQIQDTTERKATDEALALERDLLRALMDNIPDSIYFKDKASRFTRVNLAKALHSGVGSPDDLVGKTDLDAFDAVFAQETLRAEREIVESGLPQVARIEHVRNPDGKLYWVSSSKAPIRDRNGSVVGIVGISRDVTEQHEAAEALELYSRRLEILLEFDRLILAAQSAEEIADFAVRQIRALIPCHRASIGIFDHAAETVTTVAVSEDVKYPAHVGKVNPLSDGTILNIFGCMNLAEKRQNDIVYIPDLLEVSNPWPALVRMIDRGARSHVAALLATGDDAIGVVHLMHPAPGAFTDEHLAILREIAYQVAIGLQQARLREELKRQNAELEKRVAERTLELREVNAELDSFAHSVSHDLRAPLRALRGYSTILLEDDLDDEERRDFAGRIDGAAQRMDQMTRDLLAFSQVTRVEVESSPIDLSRALRDALRQLEATVAEKGARVEVESELPSVRGHRATITQAIANLVSNGVKFVRPGITPEIRVHAEPRAGRVRLWVTDNGIGISPEDQARIFAAFERLHGIEEYPGTGIGLAIVKKGIERLGGSVGVESELGHGSRFWMELPQA